MAVAAINYPGTPANGLYLLIQRSADGYAWDAEADAIEAFDAGSLADYSIAVTQLGGDLWGATIPDSLPAGNYSFTFYDKIGASESVNDDVLPGSYSGYWSGSTVGPSASGYVGRYTSYEVLAERFGLTNTSIWSNVEGGDTVNDSAIEAAIDGAEDEIDQYFSNSIYAIPFVASGASLPHTLREWATVLAGFYLYTKRGFQDTKPGGDLKMLKDEVYSEMRGLRAGYPRQLQGVALKGTVPASTTVYSHTTGNVSDGLTVTATGSRTRIGVRFIQGYGYVYQLG